jgi:hypothetical protein
MKSVGIYYYEMNVLAKRDVELRRRATDNAP